MYVGMYVGGTTNSSQRLPGAGSAKGPQSQELAMKGAYNKHTGNAGPFRNLPTNIWGIRPSCCNATFSGP